MVEPMAEPTGSGETEPSAAARERLEGELAQVRESRASGQNCTLGR